MGRERDTREVRVAVLGPTSVRRDATVIDLGPRLRRLLAALVAAHGEVVSVDRLADIVWEGSPPDRAKTTLRTYMSAAPLP